MANRTDEGFWDGSQPPEPTAAHDAGGWHAPHWTADPRDAGASGSYGPGASGSYGPGVSGSYRSVGPRAAASYSPPEPVPYPGPRGGGGLDLDGPFGQWRRQLALGMTSAVVGVLLVFAAAALVLAYQIAPMTNGGDAQGAGPTDSAATGSNGPSAGPSASGGPAGRTVTFLYDGRRPTSDLDEAMITLVDFELAGCPIGPTQFHSGVWTAAAVPDPVPQAAISAVAIADVTGDGKAEHVALVNCTIGADPTSVAAQVVALGPPANGIYPALGKVIGVTGGLTHLFQPQVGKDATVSVLVESRGADQKPTARQLRTYKWSGSAFAPSGMTIATMQSGSTKLTLAVTGTTVKLTGNATSGLRGQVSYTITNGGGATSSALSIALDCPLALAVTVPGSIGALARTDTPTTHQWRFTIAPVAANATVTGTLLLAVDPAAVASAPKSSTLNVAVNGVDIGLDQPNATSANNSHTIVARP